MDTEKTKMLRGALYVPTDPTLAAERQATREILRRFNDMTQAKTPKAQALTDELLGAKGDKCLIEMPFRCDYIHMGDRCYINFNCAMLDVCKITIENRVMLGPNVQLYTANHPLDPELRASGVMSGKPITLEDNVWIGGNSVVVPGVRIGNGAVIGAGSVITKDVAPMCVYAGNPAKFI